MEWLYRLARKNDKLIPGRKYLFFLSKIGNYYHKGKVVTTGEITSEYVFIKGSCIGTYMTEGVSKRGNRLFKFKCNILIRGDLNRFLVLGGEERIIGISNLSNIVLEVNFDKYKNAFDNPKCLECKFCNNCIVKSRYIYNGCKLFRLGKYERLKHGII